jgi:AraC-like DNA-binding protein
MAIVVFFVLRRDKSQRELNLFYRGAGKDAGQPIPSREIRKHAAKLLRFMREQKPYLDANLSLATLGASLNMSKETLSQVVNRELNLNFNAFLNQYRVEEAKALLKDPAQNQFVILKIAYDVGFNSKSSFNAAFRQLTGMTPTQYRKKHQR